MHDDIVRRHATTGGLRNHPFDQLVDDEDVTETSEPTQDKLRAQPPCADQG